MPFSNPIIGGGGTLIREAISSPDYAAGVAGWSIKRDGSAEFNDVAIRGSLTTGPDGSDHIFIPDGAAEVDFVLGTNGATARARTAQLGAGPTAMAGIDLESSAYTNTTSGQVERAFVHLRGSFGTGANVQLGLLNEASQQPVGPRLAVQQAVGGSIGELAVYDASGTGFQVGPRLRWDDTHLRINAYPAGASPGIGSTWIDVDASTGITAQGIFPTSPLVTPVFTPAANWTVNTFDLSTWGPFVRINLSVTRSAAALAAGIVNVVVGTLTFSSAEQAFPAFTEVGQAASGAGTLNAGTWFLSTGGTATLEWIAAAMPVGAAIRLCLTYFKA